MEGQLVQLSPTDAHSFILQSATEQNPSHWNIARVAAWSQWSVPRSVQCAAYFNPCSQCWSTCATYAFAVRAFLLEFTSLLIVHGCSKCVTGSMWRWQAAFTAARYAQSSQWCTRRTAQGGSSQWKHGAAHLGLCLLKVCITLTTPLWHTLRKPDSWDAYRDWVVSYK